MLAVSLPAAAETPRPSARATWTERPPKIDGRLDEPEWQNATPLSPLTEVEPNEGARPGQRTEVRILTDEDNLYVGIRSYDSDPDEIIARDMQRDGNIFREDRIGFLLDPFLDRRNGYFFQTNPLGARVDGLVEDARFLLEWDGIWNVATTIDAKGWQAEFVIPFKTLNFRAGSDTWGLNILRGVRGNEKRYGWSEPYQNRSPIDPAAEVLLQVR